MHGVPQRRALAIESVERRRFAQWLAVAGVGLGGCIGGPAGTLQTILHVRPGDLSALDRLEITVAGLWLGPAIADDASGPPQRERYDLADPRTVDLVDVENDQGTQIDERELPPGRYSFLQLDVSDTDSSRDGDSVTIELPAGAPLTFDTAFEIREDATTTVHVAVTAVRRGDSETFLLQPVPDKTRVGDDKAS